MGKPVVEKAHTLSKAILNVYPNVYAAADHLGRLSAAVRYDPEHGRAGTVHYVGATVRRKPIEGFIRKAQQERGVRKTMYDVTVHPSLTIQKLVHSSFFVRQIKDGSLIPADAATARVVGVKFVEPATALAQAREKLIAELKTLHSEEDVEVFVSKWPTYDLSDDKKPESPSVPLPAPTPRKGRRAPNANELPEDTGADGKGDEGVGGEG